MHIFFYALAGILILFSILAWLNTQVWYVKIFDFGKFQFSILIILLIAFYSIFIRTFSTIDIVLLVTLGVSFCVNFSSVLPFTPLHKKEIVKSTTTSETLSLFIANVRMKNRKTEILKKFIKERDPDLILLTEVDQYWIDELADIEKRYSYTVKQPQDNTYGMLLYSKIELLKPKVNFYVEDEIPSIRTFLKLKCGDIVNFFGLHPKPPSPWTRLINKQMEIIIVANLIKELEDPSLLAGDLNDVGWSKITSILKTTSGLSDPRIGRGFYNTYNANVPLFRYPIDHLFVSPCFKLNKLERLGKFGSDHFPMYVEVSYEPEEKRKVRQKEGSLSNSMQAS